MEKLPQYYFMNMKDIEEKFVTFLNEQDEFDEHLHIFIEFLQTQGISENKYELKLFLYLIVAICNNSYRSKSFFTKIELIIKNLQEKIQNYFTNFEIFLIFQGNKRLLLLLFKLGILTPTYNIYSIIHNNKKYTDRKYIEYLFLEFEPYMDEKTKKLIHDQIPELQNKTSNDDFSRKRGNGENDDYLCQLIQNDSVVDFITYMEKTNISPQLTIKPSIYETNSFLYNKHPTLIEYSAFYGSIQIFKYLHHRNAKLKESIWPYAIHGKNAEIIQFLEENKIKTIQDSFQYLIVESIKCHHNEIADYFKSNFNPKEKIYINYLIRKALKYYNFAYLTNDDVNNLISSCKNDQKLNVPYYLCKYDYYLFVEYLVNSKSEEIIDINYQYKIYKQPDHCTDIMKCFAIKNGDVSREADIPDLCNLERFIDRYDRINEFSKYKYKVEISNILNIAARKGNIDIIQLLLKCPKIDKNIITKKRYKESKKTLPFIIDYYVITENKTILYEAIESGYEQVFQILLQENKNDVNGKFHKSKVYHDYHSTANLHYGKKTQITLLHYAIKRGCFEITKLLLSNPNLKINSKSIYTINESGGCVCYTSSSKEITKSSLYFAIHTENTKLIQLLLENPQIKINSGISKFNYGWSNKKILQEKTPLYLAVEKQNIEIVKLLLKHPEINIESESYVNNRGGENINKMTALQLASQIENNQIHQLLSSFKKT
ncbi:hypothetical protein M9Y10_023947 [Tritrichomonas musculus]|uniref:DUF3447 domain-containing protein n=1 Tax=Tritrichomonas musculus TaxID=1915356 RepID=A0ABR2KWJ0_9EUKA